MERRYKRGISSGPKRRVVHRGNETSEGQYGTSWWLSIGTSPDRIRFFAEEETSE
jgi:hypothetical protein